MVIKNAAFKIWTFIAISLWAVALVMFTVAGEFLAINLGVLFAAALLSAGLIFYKRAPIAAYLKRPGVRKGGFALAHAFLVLAILAMINYIAVKGSKTFDLTSSKIHSLSEQSKEVAKKIEKDINIVLFSKRSEWERYLVLLRQYANINKRVSIKAVDVEEEPAIARANGIKKDGEIIIKVGDREYRGLATSELEVTNLLLKTLRDREIILYRTIGHGELDPEDEEVSGASFLYSQLRGAGYTIRALDTLQIKEAPKDADAILVLGPSQGILEKEVKLLSEYAKKGGNLLFLLGPNFKTDHFKSLRDFLKTRGVLQHNALVLDRLSAVQGANATIPIVNTYDPKHSITKEFSGRTLFPLSSALESAPNENVVFTSLALSSPFPASWAESQLNEINSGKVYYNKGLDLKGPVALLASLENKKDASRLIIGGSVEMVGNAYQNQSNNFNLFMNALAWLVGDEGVISLNRPELSNNMIILSAPQISLILYFSILFLPFVFFAIAVWTYRRKAKK